MPPFPWDDYLGESDRKILEKARFSLKMGFGKSPAILVIDAQKFEVGIEGQDDAWPSSCGAAGRASLVKIKSLVDLAQSKKIPCFFSLFELDGSGKDAGVYQRKRALLSSENWCLAGSTGAELADGLKPCANDIVFVKKKPSAFHGTPLLGYLIDRNIDTLIIVGGATSNCVRASVFDSSSYNFRTIIPFEAVFDRIPISHAISLFDMNRQFADVVSTEEVMEYLRNSG